MPTIVDRDAILRLLDEQFATIVDLCQQFDEATWDSPTSLPGWSVKDNVSHMVGTESMLLGRDTPEADLSGLAHIRNPIGQANEAWVAALRSRPGSEVLELFREVTTQRLSALDDMTQADFDEPSWTPAGPNETYGRFMRIRHFDCFMHTLDITEATGLPDVVPADHVSSALTEPVSGLGYIVGKKAALPKGVTIRIELTGPGESVYIVDNAERATLVDHIDGEPTATIRLDSVLFLRLTGGRLSPDGHLGAEIELTGDEGVGTQLVSNLAFTI